MLFLLFLGSLAVAGHASYNNEQVAHGEQTVSLLLTIWLVQRGSPESKPVAAHTDTGIES